MIVVSSPPTNVSKCERTLLSRRQRFSKDSAKVLHFPPPLSGLGGQSHTASLFGRICQAASHFWANTNRPHRAISVFFRGGKCTKGEISIGAVFLRSSFGVPSEE